MITRSTPIINLVQTNAGEQECREAGRWDSGPSTGSGNRNSVGVEDEVAEYCYEISIYV